MASSSIPSGVYNATLGPTWLRKHCKQFVTSTSIMMLTAAGLRLYYYYNPLPGLREISTVISFVSMYWAGIGFQIIYNVSEEVQMSRDLNIFYISAIKKEIGEEIGVM